MISNAFVSNIQNIIFISPNTWYTSVFMSRYLIGQRGETREDTSQWEDYSIWLELGWGVSGNWTPWLKIWAKTWQFCLTQTNPSHFGFNLRLGWLVLIITCLSLFFCIQQNLCFFFYQRTLVFQSFSFLIGQLITTRMDKENVDF